MGDEYVSTEHLLIGIAASKPNPVGRNPGEERRHRSLPAQGRTRRAWWREGHQPDAEGSYKALEKYSTDLTAAAKEGKLDPVIGRDQEIRRVIQILSVVPRTTRC